MLAAALILGQLLRSALYGVGIHDPVPANRAARVEPSAALRDE